MGLKATNTRFRLFGEDTKEWQEARLNLEGKKGELSKKIELGFSFEESGAILNNFEEVKMWKANRESIRRESAESQLPTIQEAEMKTISERRFRKILEMVGIGVRLWNSRKPTLEEGVGDF